MYITRVIVILVLLVTTLTACTSSVIPTCNPSGYTYLDYDESRISGSSQIHLKRVIWGPYLLRFCGTTDLSDNTHLQVILFKDGQVVDWLPDYRLHTYVREGTWEFGFNANEYEGLDEFPVLEVGYFLRVYERSTGTILVDFSLNLPASSTGTSVTENFTMANLDDSEWVLTSIKGYSPVIFTSISISFSGGRLQGFGGINHYSGEYVTKNPNLINLSNLVATQLGHWWRPVEKQETEYLQLLGEVVCYRIENNRLEFFDIKTKERSLVFKRK
jgi:heat shock protein HslJ